MVKTIKSSYAHNNYIILVHLVAMRERERGESNYARIKKMV